MSEILAALIRANLAGSAVVLVVLLARLPTRRWLGPELAYRLWAAPPLAALATLLPARQIATPPPAHAGGMSSALVAGALVVWLTGMAAAIGLQGLAQLAFLRERKAGRAGPAVLGVIRPRIVMPADATLYTDDERALVRAHEREHIARYDPRAGALMAVVQCILWFNPLTHLAVRVARLDQELACDAAVIRRYPGLKALYAKTLLKTQLAGSPLPFGCYWPARGLHPLEVRVGLLKAASRGRPDRLAASALVAASVVAASCVAWAAQPPQAPSPTYIWPVLPWVVLMDLSPPPHPSAVR